MITAIYFRDRAIKPYGPVGDIFVIGDKKYRVIRCENPKYDIYISERGIVLLNIFGDLKRRNNESEKCLKRGVHHKKHGRKF